MISDNFRTAHDAVTYELDDLQGLLTALDTVLHEHPGLQGPEPETAAVFALVRAASKKCAETTEAHDAEWKVAGGR